MQKTLYSIGAEEINDTKVLLVGLDTGEDSEFEHSMEELKSLAEAADKKVTGIIVQHMGKVNQAFYIGSGKVEEVREYASQCEAEEIIFDNALSPGQVKNLGRALKLPILDRTNLILDIFALRARTREARLQVETARLQYILPRLVGMRENLSRQGGTGGSLSNKGAGETKLELDRRKIEHRISELKKELEEISRTRETMRKKRSRSRIPKVALVGYTNAGKSTIMNQLVNRYGESRDKTVLEKDMLFATLDTNVRCIRADGEGKQGENKPFFLADTVGFINNLPHDLVKAFRSTLEEIKYADLLIHVVDFSDEHYRQQMKVTDETLKELGAGGIPRITVYNKADKSDLEGIPRRRDRELYMAASLGCGTEELVGLIGECVYADRVETEMLLPYDKGNVVSYFMDNATILEQEYREEGVRLRVSCHKNDADKYCEYCACL
ncbi:GTPase HflX [Acetatifactor muris]|jgi:GTP-binding protein HflX|uniref:GTPase HflX n=1 Tax=Acetatifactor muris TaxID=879566 RepID=A0A2K4ZN08_9FIRM|nr:GTPase HflX [Acetatifactor muris]MCI8800431.1 GTPase HflX [Lachnospiraceae bacterium]MCR2050145.1 GTPase HflX [Acetatifactor muris]SOY31806.1 GTPase HflX [Acetatifactor muris]